MGHNYMGHNSVGHNYNSNSVDVQKTARGQRLTHRSLSLCVSLDYARISRRNRRILVIKPDAVNVFHGPALRDDARISHHDQHVAVSMRHVSHGPLL